MEISGEEGTGRDVADKIHVKKKATWANATIHFTHHIPVCLAHSSPNGITSCFWCKADRDLTLHHTKLFSFLGITEPVECSKGSVAIRSNTSCRRQKRPLFISSCLSSNPAIKLAGHSLQSYAPFRPLSSHLSPSLHKLTRCHLPPNTQGQWYLIIWIF